MAIRVYLLFYDLKYAQSLLTHEWWNIISNDQDWYMKNKNKYGSFKWWSIRCLIFILISWILLALGMKYVPNVTIPILAICVNSVYIIMIVCFCKMPSIYDALKIRKEINILATIFFIQAGYHTVTIPFDHDQYPIFSFIAMYQTTVVATLFSIVMILMPNWDKELNFVADFQAEDSISLSPTSTTSSDSIITECTQEKNKKRRKQYKSWQMYVNDCNDDERFNNWMRHLIREWSSENLCFLLEVLQYKHQFMDMIQNWEVILAGKNYVKDASVGWIIKLPANLPQSGIISENEKDYQEQVQMLYAKYIEYNAPSELNVSFENRELFMQKFEQLGTLPENELMLIFDPLLDSILKNLASSYKRFRMNIEEYEDHQKEDIISVMMSQSK